MKPTLFDFMSLPVRTVVLSTQELLVECAQLFLNASLQQFYCTCFVGRQNGRLTIFK
jgi:hypothetical protein